MQKQDEWTVPSSVLLIQSLKSLVVLEWLIISHLFLRRRHGKPLHKPMKAKGSLPQEVQRSKLAQLSPMFPCNTGTTSRHLTYTFRMLQPGKKNTALLTCFRCDRRRTLEHWDMLTCFRCDLELAHVCHFECFCHGKNGVLRSIVGKFMSWISFLSWQYLDIDGYFILSDHFQCPEWPFSRLQWASLINLKESVCILYDMLSLWRLSIQMILANPRAFGHH